MENSKKHFVFAKECFKQAFSYKWILLGIGIMTCICLDNWGQIPLVVKPDAKIPVYSYIMNSIIYGGTYYPYLAPVLAASAYSISYCREYNCGISELLIGRMGYRKYSSVKMAVSVAAGGCTLALGVILFTIFAGIFKPLFSADFLESAQVFPYFSLIEKNQIYLFYSILVYLAFLTGALWSAVSLFVSSYVKNLYVTVTAPLFISFFVTRIYSIFEVDEQFRLDYWLLARSSLKSDIHTILILTVTVCILIIICFCGFLKKVKLNFMERGND